MGRFTTIACLMAACLVLASHTGYAQASSACTAANCALCESGSTTDCYACKRNYYLEEGTKQCARLCLAENCQECEDNSIYRCKKCDAGWWPENESKVCHRLCFPYGCVKCRDGSSDECAQCQYGCKLRPDRGNLCQCPG